MATATQICSTLSCGEPAAFRTRTKPAWCLRCISNKLARGLMTPAEPFPGKLSHWWLLECRRCQTQSHHRLVQVLDNLDAGLHTCDACRWRSWAAEGRAMGALFGAVMSEADIAAALDPHNFDLIRVLTPHRTPRDPILTRCRSCRRLEAHRLVDASFGCTCSRNSRSQRPGSARGAGRVLFADSDSPALDWWDHNRNDDAVFRTITLKARRAVHWTCPDCSKQFSEKMYEMAERPSCPDCRERAHQEWLATLARYERTLVADHPELAAAWNDPRNPRTLTIRAAGMAKLRCPNGHQPRVDPIRYLSAGCPSCRADETRKTNRQMLADTLPEIAAQWHPDRNGALTPAVVVWDSQRTVWWRADCCGYEWQDTPRDRDKYERLRCPQCRTLLGSLAWTDPGLAMEWAPENPLSPWLVRPKADPGFTPEWICATDPTHRWRMALATRSDGGACPDCRETGKSRVELEHFTAAKDHFPLARSGARVRHPQFTTRDSWSCDILFTHPRGPVVVEYDGAYWHAGTAKHLVDAHKTRDLIAGGYLVVRLRENDLPFLDLDHPHLLQLRVHATAPRPHDVMDQVASWLDEAAGPGSTGNEAAAAPGGRQPSKAVADEDDQPANVLSLAAARRRRR